MRQAFVVLLVIAGGVSTACADHLLALLQQPGLPLVRIDSVTGAVTPLFDTNASGGVSGPGFDAFDAAGRREFYLLGGVGTQQLLEADLNSSTATTKPIPSPVSYMFFVWDAATQRILSAENSAQLPVVAIDPATGTVTTLFNTNGPPLSSGALRAFDRVGRRLHFLVGPVGSQSLVSADLTTNTATVHSIASSDAYHVFEWDAATQRIVTVTSAAGNPVVLASQSVSAVPIPNTAGYVFVGFESTTGPAVPALDPRAMILLAIALSVAGALALRR